MVFCNEKFIDVADGRKNDYIRVWLKENPTSYCPSDGLWHNMHYIFEACLHSTYIVAF